MTDIVFRDTAAQLLENLYLPIPITPGQKNPALKDWLNYDHKNGFEGCGTGIITGQKRGGVVIAGIDIDLTDPDLAQEVRASITALHGATLGRVGKAPKILLVYATDSEFTKITSKQYEAGRVEILGNGQQFVAFGTHPETNQPYQWKGSNPLEAPAYTLPVIRTGQLEEIVKRFETLMEEKGHKPTKKASQSTAPRPDNFLEALQGAIDLPLSDAKDCISMLDCDDRDVWRNVGMALHHEYVGKNEENEAFDLWDIWSRGSEKYREEECRYMWDRFQKNTGERYEITARWLVRQAREARQQEELSRKEATKGLLESDIEGCEDADILLEHLAPRINDPAFGPGIRAILTQSIRNKFQAITGQKLSAPVLNDALRSKEKSGEGLKYELTEIGNSYRFLDSSGEDVMYCPEMERWYRWEEGRWSGCVKEMVLRDVQRSILSIEKEAQQQIDKKTRKTLIKWALDSQKSSMMDSVMKIARKDPRVMVLAADMDNETDYIGVSNGAVHLPTGTLIEPDKGLRITLNTQNDYDPAAPAPIFEQTVREALFDNEEMIKFLQRVVGYSILGKPEKEEILIIPVGRGANGKSTIFNAIADALGDYARFASADTFVAAKSSQGGASSAREDVLRLSGSRFVYVTELEEGGILKESFVKGITGGEAIPARGLYSRHTVEVTPTWVTFMPTNHLPIVKGEDKGIWRKILVIPFDRDFTADSTLKKDEHRKDKVKAESAGILRWCIDGALEYQRIGLSVPKCIRDASNEYREDMDVLAEWVNECCEIGENFAESNRQLWTSWDAYARSAGKEHVVRSSNALTRRLKTRGYLQIKNQNGIQGRGLKGIRIKNSEWDD